MDIKPKNTLPAMVLLALAALLLAPSAQATGAWVDASPTGQNGDFDCTYNSTTNSSVHTERWTVTVWVGTTSAGNPNPPLASVVIPYPFPDVDSGDTCGPGSSILEQLLDADSDE